jgi:hypothetical protein
MGNDEMNLSFDFQNGIRNGFNSVLSQLRHEVAQAIDSVANHETDPVVAQKIRMVGFMVARELSYEEAQRAMENPPIVQDHGKFAASVETAVNDEMKQIVKS